MENENDVQIICSNWPSPNWPCGSILNVEYGEKEKICPKCGEAVHFRTILTLEGQIQFLERRAESIEGEGYGVYLETENEEGNEDETVNPFFSGKRAFIKVYDKYEFHEIYLFYWNDNVDYIVEI